MITGYIGNLVNAIDFSELDITFSAKPIIHSGTANDTFRNKEYVENSMKHMKSYETVPNVTIYNDKY